MRFKKDDNKKSLADLIRAAQLDKSQWRYGQGLINYYLSNKEAKNALTIAAQYYKQFRGNYVIGMLNVKALMINGQYDKANSILNAIQILPYEGATDGRQLYRETQLMLAVGQMKIKNYKNALKYIAAARQWPENLGAGKPYDEDIDERLEDWLAYQNYLHLNNADSAIQMLDKIISFNNIVEHDGNNFSSANDLVTAWAFNKAGNPDQAQKYLQQILNKNPESIWAQWAINVYNRKTYKLPEINTLNENYRILNKWITISEEK